MKHFFLAGHIQYVRYITQHLMELRAHDEYNVDLGHWTADPSDRFGDQSATRIDKGTLKYMPLSYDLVSR